MPKKNKKSADTSASQEEESLVTESFAGEAMESIEDLVGHDELTPNDGLALLRLDSKKLNPELIKEFKLSKIVGAGPVIAGPFALKDLEAWSAKGLVRATDLIQVPFTRWLPASEYFDTFPKNEMTSTIEMSSFTLSGTNTVEMTKTMEAQNTEDDEGEFANSSDNSDVLELESSDEQELRAKASVSEAPSVNYAKSQTQTIVMPTPSSLPKSKQAKVDSVAGPSKASRNLYFAVGLLIFAGIVFKGFIKSKALQHERPGSESTVPSENLSQLDLSTDWPEWLQPLPTQALVEGDDALMNKLAPLMAYVRYGNYSLSETQVQTLKKIASPATASWKARKIASNILAIWMVTQDKSAMPQAIGVLKTIYESSPDDYVTVSNLAMLSLENGDLSGAEELSQVALRLCSRATCWFSNFLMANVKIKAGQPAAAEKYFQDAADDFAEPLVIWGSWAESLARDENVKHASKARSMLDRAVWGDPDRFFTSPLPDGIGAVLLYRRLSAELSEFVTTPSLSLSVGQQEYVKWRLGLISAKATIADSAPALNLLSVESSPLSQLLSTYLLMLKGDLDHARDRLTSILVLLKDIESNQSWPWTFAGDLQAERGSFDQALIFYQSALNRASHDRGAVYGLGQLMRKKSDYQGAQQKFGEAAAMDVQYVLPKLRISRFEWLRRLRDK